MIRIVQRATVDGCRALTNDERLAVWAQRHYAGGHHHYAWRKPRVRLAPNTTGPREPAPAPEPGGPDPAHINLDSEARFAAESLITDYAAIRGE